MRDWVWRTAVVCVAAGVVVVLLLHVLWPLPGHEAREWAAGLLAFPVAAALILLRRPRNPIGRRLGVVAVAAGVIFLLLWFTAAHRNRWSDHLDAISTSVSLVHFWAIVSLLYLFPTGRPAEVFGRRAYAAFTGWAVLMVLWTPFVPGPLNVFNDRPNPMGVGPAWLASVHDAAIAGLLLGAVGGVVAIHRRRRRAGPEERAQLKWFASAAVLVLALVLVIALLPEGQDAAPWQHAVGLVIVLAAFWSLPAAIVVAVLRHHLYDIDRLVSRTVGYVVVVAALLATYLGAVLVLSSLLPGSSDLAVAASTLAAAALFDPVRRRVLRAVDRRFDRTRYDRDLEVARWAGRLRDEVTVDGVRGDLLTLVGATLQPAAAAVVMLEHRPAEGRADRGPAEPGPAEGPGGPGPGASGGSEAGVPGVRSSDGVALGGSPVTER